MRNGQVLDVQLQQHDQEPQWNFAPSTL
jgi:hypothetical protein